MASANPFDILGDGDSDVPSSLLVAAQKQKVSANKTKAAATPAPAKLPSKPLPPAQAVKESRYNTAPLRDGAGRGGSGRGRGGRGAGAGQNRDCGDVNNHRYGGRGDYGGGAVADAGNPYGRERENSDQYRGSFRGGRRGVYMSGRGEGGFDPDRPQRRVFKRISGTVQGYEMKREGAGRGNWGAVTDNFVAQETEEDVNLNERVVAFGRQVDQDDGQGVHASKDKEEASNQAEEKEPEANEMTLEEYEKVREEKRKAFLAMKVEERKVEVDKDLKSMQQLSMKKGNDDVFIKLGSDKDLSKRRDSVEKEDRARKAMSINEFLKPVEGERFYKPSVSGRGRGRGDSGSFRGGYEGGASISPDAPSIEDQGQFPTLGAKSSKS